jgi:hypothetical protein
VWQGVLGHHPCLPIRKFNLINTFYITIYPSVGVLRVSFFWNFDFIALANSTRKERVLEGICSATDLAYFVASFAPRNVVWHQKMFFMPPQNVSVLSFLSKLCLAPSLLVHNGSQLNSSKSFAR